MKPEYRILIPENIPIALKKIPQWVVWRGSLAGGKWTKPPFDPKTGKKASIINPGNWADYETAFEVYQRGGYDGLGFILTVESNLVAFDFDHCVHDTGIDPEVKGHLDTLKTYTEFSPTDGIRALAFGRKPGDQCKLPSKGYEIYDKGRYVTITGHIATDHNNIEKRQAEIETVYKAIWPDRKPKGRLRPSSFVNIPDHELLEKAFGSKNGAKIQALYKGDTTGYPSQSEADQAFCDHLAFWTGRDAGRVDRIFRSSGLMREKWDRRAKGQETYGVLTINKAITNCGNIYEPEIRACSDRYPKGGEKVRTPEQMDDEWDPPIPLGKCRPRPMPEDLIPGPVGAMVKAVSCFTETPYELAAGLGFVAVASAVAGKVEVEVKPRYSESTNVMILPALETGNRKSEVVKLIFAPHLAWEKKAYAEAKPEIDRISSKNSAIDARIKKLNVDYAKADDPRKRESILRDIHAAMDEKELPPIPPRVIFDDITPEHMGTMAALYNGRMALISDEGGIFDIMAGRYSSGVPNIDLFLKGYSGTPVRVDRGSREPVTIDKPAISLGISPQPETLVKLGAIPGFRTRGVMARIGFLMPKSLLGKRTFCGPEMPARIISEYSDFIFGLLDIPMEEAPLKVKLSDEARMVWLEFACYVESEMNVGGKFENIKDWAAKLPGFAVRLSGLIHVMEGGGAEVSSSVMDKALSMAAVFVEHALYTFDVIGEEESFNVARKILSWIERTGSKKFSKRDCFKALQGTFRTMDKAEPGFLKLAEHSYIKIEMKTSGGRPSCICHVNPALFEVN